MYYSKYVLVIFTMMAAAIPPEIYFSLLMFLTANQVLSEHNNHWTPQLGTIAFPKTLALSPHVKRGSIYKSNNGNFYKALSSFDTSKSILTPFDNNFEDWVAIEIGSVELPKNVQNDEIEHFGEVFRDFENDQYYFSNCIPKATSKNEKHSCLQEYNINSDWMTRIRYYIGNTRLGDLTLPGSHDSGTKNITEDSYLIEKSEIFRLGYRITPQVMVNWSITQDSDLLQQLQAGYRHFDLRVADCEIYGDSFRWWHGLSADLIFEGLQHILDFAESYPNEIIILDFDKFVSPGDNESSTLPISPARKEELSDILLSYLGEFLVPYVNVSDNPTVNEILETGRNIIAFMHDDDIRGMSDLYWPFLPHSAWSGRSNPEDVFTERSAKLEDYLKNHNSCMTMLSGCYTTDAKIIAGALERAYGDDPFIEEIIDRIAPALNELDADMMSFEGLFVDLVSGVRYGHNNNGMHVRPDDLYSNGGSIHYSGMSDMYHHWLARPGKFKPNLVGFDDVVATDSFISTSILANLDEIPREASISFQGNSRNGFYYWANFTAYGGEEGLLCTSVQVSFTITSSQFSKSKRVILSDPYELTLKDGEYPPDSTITVEVTSQGNPSWYELGTFVIAELIDIHYDLYIRGDDIGEGHGFAYIGTIYNSFGEECGLLPVDEDSYDSLIEW